MTGCEKGFIGRAITGHLLLHSCDILLMDLLNFFATFVNVCPSPNIRAIIPH